MKKEAWSRIIRSRLPKFVNSYLAVGKVVLVIFLTALAATMVVQAVQPQGTLKYEAGTFYISENDNLKVGGDLNVGRDLLSYEGKAGFGNIGADLILKGRGGGVGNNNKAGRALVDYGSGGLIINYANDFGKVTIDGDPVKITDNLNVGGTIKEGDTSLSSKYAALAAGVPSGAVMFFNLSSCPTGWSELTTARGRYIVGLPSGGTLAGTAGTALTNQENRAVGEHNHSITDPAHTHTVDVSQYSMSGTVGGGSDRRRNESTRDRTTTSATTGITINNAGSVAGTNAPYIQFLVCQKL